jgi:hypothetical protein
LPTGGKLNFAYSCFHDIIKSGFKTFSLTKTPQIDFLEQGLEKWPPSSTGMLPITLIPWN